MPQAESACNGLIEAVRFAARGAIKPWFRNTTGDEIDTKTGPVDAAFADHAAERVISPAAARLLPGALVIGESPSTG